MSVLIKNFNYYCQEGSLRRKTFQKYCQILVQHRESLYIIFPPLRCNNMICHFLLLIRSQLLDYFQISLCLINFKRLICSAAQLNEALQIQKEVQRRLCDQLEVF